MLVKVTFNQTFGLVSTSCSCEHSWDGTICLICPHVFKPKTHNSTFSPEIRMKEICQLSLNVCYSLFVCVCESALCECVSLCVLVGLVVPICACLCLPVLMYVYLWVSVYLPVPVLIYVCIRVCLCLSVLVCVCERESLTCLICVINGVLVLHQWSITGVVDYPARSPRHDHLRSPEGLQLSGHPLDQSAPPTSAG